MHILPFLSTPCIYGLIAYKSTRVEAPVVNINLFGQKQFHKGSLVHNSLMKTLPGYKIKKKLQPFLDQIRIRQDLIILEQINPKLCTAEGTNFFTKGAALISVSSDFHNTDEDACHFLVKREVCHIKNNDYFFLPLVPAICSTVAAASTSTISVIPSLLTTISVGIITHALFLQFCDNKADDLVIAESSAEELKGGRRFLMSLQQVNLESRAIWNKIKVSSNDDQFLKKIECALQQKNTSIDVSKEAKKITKLKKFIIKNNVNQKKS